jgi:hypothetical protein
LVCADKKGEYTFEFGKPLQEELEIFDELPNSKKQLEALAGIIDKRIHKNYALHGINEIADKLLREDNSPCTRCEEGEDLKLLDYFSRKKQQLQNDTDGSGYRYLLGMYANPLINAQSEE